MCGFGADSDWFRNLEADPACQVTIGGRRFDAAHRVVPADEAATVMADYERRHRFMAPVVRAGLSWLAGWRYHGTEADRSRLVDELPMVAFRPRE